MGKLKKNISDEVLSVLNKLKININLAGIISLEYEKALDKAVAISANILGCDRSCIMLLDSFGKLVLKAGFPKKTDGGKESHGVGREILPKNGGDFLRKIMNERSVIMINDTNKHPELMFMEDLIKRFEISSMIILPLFSCAEPLGVMVFDFTQKNSKSYSKLYLNNLDIIANIVSSKVSGCNKLTTNIVNRWSRKGRAYVFWE
jgi:transcriptional regulator with GAF, ATPase, and Fis domain